MSDLTDGHNLSLQDTGRARSILVIGEVLWDMFAHSTALGGAPLNFAAHARRLGYDPLLISAVGTDSLGDAARQEIAALGLDASFLQTTSRFPTGTARVELGPEDQTRFVIERPAAYDALRLREEQIAQILQRTPECFYHGTLFAATPEGRVVVDRLFGALPAATRFYDLNLRPGNYSVQLVMEMLEQADVVKLNEEELGVVCKFTRMPSGIEAFCREGSKRYGWKAVCVTLGARGCGMLCCEEYVEAVGHTVKVADPVGAGDAFAAAFLHGLISHWPVRKIAEFANRVGALVASRPGAIPDWTVKEAAEW
ncbi:MAG TPA: PfkB family carbohydrate kinase [Bryobacteraceae bacterium]|nr:PfkB family carbohydrate kinase [Bryobacteraceae bacterium]